MPYIQMKTGFARCQHGMFSRLLSAGAVRTFGETHFGPAEEQEQRSGFTELQSRNSPSDQHMRPNSGHPQQVSMSCNA